MELSFEFWFMLPIAIVIATIAMSSGVGGATFFSPLFILVLGLRPEIAIGAGLVTEVFGFGSGLYAYFRKKYIDFRLSFALLITTVPLALIGSLLANRVDGDILKVMLGVGLFGIALNFLKAPEEQEVTRADAAIEEDFGADKGETCLVTAEGESICYTVCNKTEGRIIAGIGGLFVGLISTGLGELNGYFLLRRCRVPSKVSVATSVLVIAVTVLFASVGHVAQFAQADPAALETIFSLVIFTIPGVIIGGQLGPILAKYVPSRRMEQFIAVLFIIIAALTLAEVFLAGE